MTRIPTAVAGAAVALVVLALAYFATRKRVEVAP